VHVRRGGITRRAVAQGRDIYAVTAPLIVEALERVLAGDVPGAGAWSAGEAFDARGFLEALSPAHFTLAFEEESSEARRRA
jgi:hypothetical protein